SAFAAVRRNAVQFDTFYVNRDGALWTAWRIELSKDPKDKKSYDAELEPGGFAEPGASLAAVQRTDSDLDVFVIGRGNKLWRFCERDNGDWNHEEIPGPASAMVSGAPVAAVRRANNLVDVFLADDQGYLWAAQQQGWTENRAPIWQVTKITGQSAGRIPLNG